MENTLKAAVLGYGHIGRRHAQMIARNEAYELVALIDPKFITGAKAEVLGVPGFSCLEDFFNSQLPVDLIAVCTPNGLHFEQAKTIIEHNISVIIEKPIALQSAQVELLEQVAVQHGVHIFPVMQNRFSPPALWLKDLIESEILGNLFMVQIACFWNRNEHYYAKGSWRGTKNMDGGTLYTQFSHYLDIMFWLFGDITNIKSKFADFNHSHLTEFEDSGIITFDFASGGMGSFTFSTSVWNENLESSLTIIAENGSVKVGGQYMNHVEKCIIKDYTAPELPATNGANDYGSFKGSAQNHQHLYRNVIDFLRHGKEIQTTTDDSVKVLKMIENIYSSN
ncbi:Gfo/Idh/MocA family oxidoreductase [Chryseobacterium gotjawalense]|uniref:Gfo/Idh/MocA family oxidoreductase n=1 Tax=Chryseobacterium gotjawalense TaxID=3042315 RepID=A0ABY8RGP0_9FLAO|nr:Gfo/Idh/MocA family oxidoreductase [Chryseobacterium sp. wdc7]WHF53041.1 Gfo/Idh/MocA family oxidoreductase [Chryseobacterium sp. wdc7]